jgi:NodT family efflux transporter outer membrane factor (OMF) lipoprotein
MKNLDSLFKWPVYFIISSSFFAGCSLAPKYKLPIMPIPVHYKNEGPWVDTKPALDAITTRKNWWQVFQDPRLDLLERRVSCNNNNLKIALARYDEARALLEVSRSALYPSIQGIGTIARQKNSKALNTSSFPVNLTNNTFLLAAVLNYEIDIWGRVRNSVIASESLTHASADDLDSISLSLHAELASDYFQLRAYDEAQRVLNKTVIAYQKSLYLTRQRHKGGMVAASDVDEAMTQFENAKTAATENRLIREKLEHAIAVLIGEIPANFSLKPQTKPIKLATVAPDLASTLLLRRPDIAAASERVRAANAQIGVARAAFFPQFNLFNLLGFQSNTISNLFSKPNLLWSLGPSTALSLIQPEISQVIFDGFKRRGLLHNAKAIYFETVDQYRQSVLDSFREVEDSLASIHRLDQEKISQTKASNAATRALYQANQQYHGGLVTYLDVVVYENTALQAELALIDIKNRRQLASVQLIKALGGGW